MKLEDALDNLHSNQTEPIGDVRYYQCCNCTGNKPRCIVLIHWRLDIDKPRNKCLFNNNQTPNWEELEI